MKEITEEETRTIVKHLYEATDGTTFTDTEQCLAYEKTYKCAIMTKLLKYIVNQMPEPSFLPGGNGSDDWQVYIIHVENDDAYTLIIQLLRAFDPKLFEHGDNKYYVDEYNRVMPLLEECASAKDYLAIGICNYDESAYVYGTLTSIANKFLNFKDPTINK